MLYHYPNGATSVILRVKIRDSRDLSDAGLTALTSASAGLIISTICDNEAAAVVYTQAAGTIEAVTTIGTYAAPTATKCRFKLVDNTNHPGLYELQFADARFAVASAKELHITITGPAALNIVQEDYKVQLAPAPADVKLWLAAAVNALVSGRVDASVGAMAANVLTATAIAADAITAAKIAPDAIGASELAADAVTEIQSGLATAASIATVQADTDDIQTRLPAALVGGRIDASVGAMAANVVTAAAIAADAIGASELAADAVTEIQSGLATAAGIAAVQADTDDIQTRLPAALVGGRMDSSTGAMAAGVLTATAIAADAITAAKIAPDAIGASELAADAVTEIQTAILTDATPFAGASIAAIKAKTDNLPTDPADASDIAAAIASLASTLATILAAVDTEVAAIKAKTDQLAFSTANKVDASILAAGDFAQGAADKVFGASGAVLPELAQGVPVATPTPRAAMMLLYMALRNLVQVTATEKRISNDAGTIIAKKTLSDDGTTYAETEMVSGP